MAGSSTGELPASFGTLLTSPLSNKYDALHFTEKQSLSILTSPLAQTIFSHDQDGQSTTFADSVRQNVANHLQSDDNDDTKRAQVKSQLLHVGYAALCVFIQANVTGPPLPSRLSEVIIQTAVGQEKHHDPTTLRRRMIRDLSVDGEAAYSLIPFVELFVVARAILTGTGTSSGETLMPRLIRLRVNFVHQKLLAENAETLENAIYEDLRDIAEIVLAERSPAIDAQDKVRFLLERATIHIHHGLEEKARADLESAAKWNDFEFAVTGRLGKRTKFQTRDYSQLVVLAKGRDRDDDLREKNQESEATKPKKLDLNDDTLLESISFTKDEEKPKSMEKSLTVQDESSLSPTLAKLDASDQPQLSTLDSITLLSIASAITNTSPDHGLTREETIPYATRVLDGKSTNWQVYSQALLVRSRIEGHASRTVERSVLQLQGLVDQVIADTTEQNAPGEEKSQQPTTFLPRPEASESAPAVERIEYVWYINFPTRWSLEAELAQRWVNLGGLRTALDIYERLQMWAEAALCLAATEREDKARSMVRKQLFHPTHPGPEENDKFEGPELEVLPPDAPRLFCILGDIDADPAMYERAWTVSNERYGRAQRSLARHYISSVKPPAFEKAEEAYEKSLKVSRLNHAAWFSLGCIQLELQKWKAAVESFTRAVQLEESDAEAWSNLAAALVNVPPSAPEEASAAADDEEQPDTAPKTQTVDPYKPQRDALAALHRAARFKHDDHRIWDNLLTVATSIPPPHTPFRDVLLAFRRIIDIRSPKRGEKCVDVDIFAALVNVLETNYKFDNPDVSSPETGSLKPGTLPAGISKLVDEAIVPLITHSAPLWLLVAKVESWHDRPSKALLAHEKAWRATVAAGSRGAFEMGEEKQWAAIVGATETLVRHGYAVYGGMEKEDQGPQEEGQEELVAKDWRFKSRSAVRGILGKGKEFWEGTEGWDKLKELAADVSGG